MTSVLVTGCAGFIGSNLCDELLSKKFKVVGIDNFDPFYSREIKEANLPDRQANPGFKFYEIDLANRSALDTIAEPIDVVVHLAAKVGVRPSIGDPQTYIEANITGTRHLLDFMKTRGIKKMVFASSSSVYGDNTAAPFSENANVDFPISPYAFTKKSCELLNHTYHHLYGIDVINLRFFTVYGRRQRPDLAIHKFVKAIYKHEPITLYGDGSSARDYTYVHDIVKGTSSCMEYCLNNNNVFETINLGNNKPVKLSELVNMIYETIGEKPQLIYSDKQPGDVEITCADISKANKLLNYHPETDMRAGLKAFTKWYRDTYLK